MSATEEVSRGVCHCCMKEFSSFDEIAGHYYAEKCPSIKKMIQYGVVSPGGVPDYLTPKTTESGVVMKISVVSAPNTWYLLVSVPDSFDLGQLDEFLRIVWCGCDCGHLSQFTSPKNPNQCFPFERKVVDLKRSKILYEFDSEHPCRIQIDFLFAIQSKVVRIDTAVVLARNLIPSGNQSNLNCPRALAGCKLSDEVLAMSTVFDLLPGSGDPESRRYAAEKNQVAKTENNLLETKNSKKRKPAVVDDLSGPFDLTDEADLDRGHFKRTRTSLCASCSPIKKDLSVEDIENISPPPPPVDNEDGWMNLLPEDSTGHSASAGDSDDEPLSFDRGRSRKSQGSSIISSRARDRSSKQKEVSWRLIYHLILMVRDTIDDEAESSKVREHIFDLYPEIKPLVMPA